MSHRIFWITTLIFTSLVVVPANTAATPANVLLIVDASGSMKNKVGNGQTRLATAKLAVGDLVKQMPADTELGLMFYGHRRAKDCADIELVAPVAANNADNIVKRVNAVDAKGETPIADSLRRAAKAFSTLKGRDNHVVLVTDGIEECGGDPCAAATEVKNSGLDVKIDIVGFTLTGAQGKAIKCVTQITGGTYYPAQDAKALGSALQQVKQEIASAAPVKAAEHDYGGPIRGGDAFDGAVSLKPGTLYHLNYVQPVGRQDFFKIDAHGGQQIRVTLTGGVTSPIAGELADAKRQTVVGMQGAGFRAVTYLAGDLANGQDGTYFLLIEHAFNSPAVGTDATFQVDLVSQYDANTTKDAGADENTAIELKPGVFPKNNLNDADSLDVFKFVAEGGKVYAFKTRPGADKGVMVLNAVDGDGVAIGQGRSPNGGAVAKIENLKLAKTGPIFVKVSFDRGFGQPAGDYSMALGTGDVQSPPKPAAR